eukprot:2203425-Rhodomonas_salina.1
MSASTCWWVPAARYYLCSYALSQAQTSAMLLLDVDGTDRDRLMLLRNLRLRVQMTGKTGAYEPPIVLRRRYAMSGTDILVPTHVLCRVRN